MNKVVDALGSVCKETTEKVNKLITNSRSFMSTFQSSFESNTVKATEVISSLRSTLRIEKAKLEEVHIGLQVDTSELNTSISSKIQKLQDDLATEINIMDALVVKTKKVKVFTIKLENVEKQMNELLSKRAVVKSCVADVNTLLSDIIETRDSMITTTVKKHLAKKLRLVFAMLNQLEGVSESSSILKQRGENVKQSKKENHKSTVKTKKDNEPKDNMFGRAKTNASLVANMSSVAPTANTIERTFSFSSINKEAEEEEEIFRFQKEWAILDETRKEINSPTEHMSGQGTNLLDQNDDPSQTISSSAQTEDIEGGGSPEQSNTTQARDTVIALIEELITTANEEAGNSGVGIGTSANLSPGFHHSGGTFQNDGYFEGQFTSISEEDDVQNKPESSHLRIIEAADKIVFSVLDIASDREPKVRGNLDKVQHELQKAKLMLNETFTTLLLEPALSTVPLFPWQLAAQNGSASSTASTPIQAWVQGANNNNNTSDGSPNSNNNNNTNTTPNPIT
ncbi:uncharacterized protein LOC128126781 [Lactuca sativa]|uniref:uncharacterized protein LOC128126781 n=1 Tax=Lactuca sativa TaxID=4236 RepID=UPI0022AFB38E|nr:uncharacterized protein LOC128126781 [Lactuca sativa]